MNIIDVKNRLHEKSILSVLSHSVYMPTDDKMNRLADDYQADADIHIFACTQEEAVLGVIGVQTLAGDSVQIRGMAVDPTVRGRGIGSKLIAFVGSRFPGCQIIAETDDDAVGFYRSCGFAIESLGEKYPGVIRYLCTLAARD